MIPSSDPWRRLSELSSQFQSNLNALETRQPRLAESLRRTSLDVEYQIQSSEQRVNIARKESGGLTLTPNPVPVAAASQISSKLFPSGKCGEPVLVAGLDQGWLWKALYELPTDTPAAPGHRPPLYLLTPDIERLWIALHLHDWANLLADPRVRLFAGADSLSQAQHDMSDAPQVPWPKLCVTVDPATWPPGCNFDALTRGALESVVARMKTLQRELDQIDRTTNPASLSQRFGRGKLRVLGITSRYTTFLQFSMRDWLSAFEELGHETRLLIESGDHELLNPIAFAQACADFHPDLIVMIDHYRAEHAGLPANVPWIMWIQDRLPGIYSSRAGTAQKAMDYAIGYGRLECVHQYGYPAERFLPVTVGTNEKRFSPQSLGQPELSAARCDVSFVSHATVPADVLVQNEIARQSKEQNQLLLKAVFDSLRSVYDQGGSVTESHFILKLIREVLAREELVIDNEAPLAEFFVNRVNNALFRHQALTWLTEIEGLTVHLYGRGWERHPRFSHLARGVADNERQLCAIYQGSTINLQVTPFGAAHQ
ncbi:MAG: hypothetical protein ACREJC_04350, partial [Tepidisphaeraceae bacterium]